MEKLRKARMIVGSYAIKTENLPKACQKLRGFTLFIWIYQVLHAYFKGFSLKK